ncbi:MAG TPA: M56 family metallopeptidase [Gemmatimonadaceae bacterium]|nr:M56 family metallopeptidase [Gemmatimonadaceae bacterium]
MIPTLLTNIFAMPASNVATLMMLAKATLILVTAVAVTVTMRRASAGARHLVWLVTLGTLLLVPALTAWSPLRLAILPASTVTSSAVHAKSSSTALPSASASTVSSINRSEPVDATSSVSTQHQITAPAPTTSIFARISNLSGFSALLAIWAAVVIVLAGWLAYGALAVRRIVRRARPLDTADWLTPLYEVSDRLAIDQAPRLLRSEDAKMPFACGLVTPTIVLPADCDNWTQDRRLAVLLHELAHVRRHDLAGHTLGRLACALYWFHPLVWTAAKQLRSESERACDDLALSCGARPSDYAEHLLDIVTSVRHDATPAVALAMARRKEFEGRMLAILDPELVHSSPNRWQSAGLIASLAVVAIFVSAAAPAPRAARVERQVAANATRHEGVTLAPAPKIELPTMSKIEQNPAPVPKRVPQYPDSGVPGGVTTKTTVDRVVNSIVQNTIQQTRNVLSFNDQERINKEVAKSTPTQSALTPKEQEQINKSVAKAAADLGNASAQAALKYLGIAGKAVTAQGKDDRPVLLANILRTDADPSLRRIAAWGLADYSETSVATDALANAVRRDANASVREMAAWALGEGNDGNGTAIDALSAALHDSDVKVRATATWALGEIGDNSALDNLIPLLADQSTSIRMRAVWAIGQISPRQAPAQLIALLRDPSPQIREITAWALFEIEDPNAVSALDAALRTETSQGLQLAYIKALAATGEKSVDAVRRLLDSKDPQVRSLAVRALAGGHGAGPWPWPWPEPRPQP